MNAKYGVKVTPGKSIVRCSLGSCAINPTAFLLNFIEFSTIKMCHLNIEGDKDVNYLLVLI